MKVNMNTIIMFLFLSLFACRQNDRQAVTPPEGITVEDTAKVDGSVEDTFPEIDAPLATPVEKDNLQSEKKQKLDDKIMSEVERIEEDESVEKEKMQIISDSKPDNDNSEQTKETLLKVQSQKEVSDESSIQEPAKAAAPNHESFDALLNEYVSGSGAVDYAGLKKAEGKLDDYLEVLSSNPVDASWSRNEKLAFWINAYNAYTIKLILKNYPVKSIMDINSGKAWDLKWVEIGSKMYSLNEIENQIIRPQFNEPRIHFAVNCAAQSCPPLSNKAYTSANLETMLENNARKFINNPKYNTITEKSAEISRIFDWYGEDFGNIINYLNKYSVTDIRNNAKVKFKEYDWALNGK